jgi:pantoate--beta-alanine ligase
MAAWQQALRREAVLIGMVPTMGALHAGHRALIRTARLSSDAVVVSIFVNPTQFGPGEDFSRYPRRLQPDAALCEQEGVDILFAPSSNAMYPEDFETSVTVEHVTQRWEGVRRPGHFSGVATVVTKLVGLIRPDVMFFGQKDYQQVVAVRRLVSDLNLGTTVQMCRTVRDRDGLALSSRNEYLSPAERRAAPVLYAALQAGSAAIRGGARTAARVINTMEAIVGKEPLVRKDYLAVCDPDSLEPLDRVTGKAVLLGAIQIGSIRLIDNVIVKGKGGERAGT